MKFLVCISNVPDTTTKISFTDNNTQFNSSGVTYILNPYDELSIARAVELAEGGKASITVIHVGEVSADPMIRKALALGADDAIRINSKPLDAFFVASQIAELAKKETYDLIFFGRESIDFNGSQVCAMVAEMLGIPSVSIVKKLELNGNEVVAEREIEGGIERISSHTPLALSCSEGIAEVKIVNMRGIMSAKTKPLLVVEPVSQKANTVILQYETPKPRGQVNLIDPSNPAALVELLHTQAKVI